MKCPKCGSDVPEDASFCINCGATVNGEAEKVATEAGPPEKEKPEPIEPEPGPAEPEPGPPAEPEKPPELAASEAPDELPEPDRKLEETPPETEKPPKPEPAKPEPEKKPAEKTGKSYRDYRKPITAVIFIVVIICSIFACCAFCVLISSMEGYGF